MPATEQLQPLTPGANHAPADPNVVVPAHVRAAAEAADAAHRAAYQSPEPAPAPVAPEPAPAPEPVSGSPELEPQPAQQPQVAPQPAPQPEPAQQITAGSDEDRQVPPEEWRRRFFSMQGRYQQAQRQIGSMEQQMTELGQELVRTQNMISAAPQPAAAPDPAQRGHHHEQLITAEDREAYGDELIDLARRAAMETVGPQLEALKAENERLTSRVKNTGRRELFITLDQQMPQWRQINKAPQFLAWLRLRNVYTGQIRSDMLKAAVEGAQAPVVLSLFRDFLAEANATGQTAPAAQAEHLAPQPAPREPALSLDALTAPGKARPASGDGQVPLEKPTYTRAQIAQFYDARRRGAYAGREAEAAALEADIIAANGQGRIR